MISIALIAHWPLNGNNDEITGKDLVSFVSGTPTVALDGKTGKSFTFVKETKILAQETGFDGFYMALLERK